MRVSPGVLGAVEVIALLVGLALATVGLVFVYHYWADYAREAREWEPATCRATDAEVADPCRRWNPTCDSSDRLCVYMQVVYAEGRAAPVTSDRAVRIRRDGECEFWSRDAAEAEVARIQARAGERVDFPCFAVPGDDTSVSEDDPTQSRDGEVGRFFFHSFVSLLILSLPCVYGVFCAKKIRRKLRVIRQRRPQTNAPDGAPAGDAPARPAAAAGGQAQLALRTESQIDGGSDKTQTLGTAGGGDAVAECGVCLDSLRAGELGNRVRLSPCNHWFHRACIRSRTLRGDQLCPTCRADTLGLGVAEAV
jgi:hypothetical protein